MYVITTSIDVELNRLIKQNSYEKIEQKCFFLSCTKILINCGFLTTLNGRVYKSQIVVSI